MVAWTCQRQGRPLDCSTSSSGPGADSEEKREPVSDIDIAVADSLKVLDLKRPIREADIEQDAPQSRFMRTRPIQPHRTGPCPRCNRSGDMNSGRAFKESECALHQLIWNYCSQPPIFGDRLFLSKGAAHDAPGRLRQSGVFSQPSGRDREAAYRRLGRRSAVPNHRQGVGHDDASACGPGTEGR